MARNNRFSNSMILIGNTLEFYDFMLYGVLASYISANFFPAQNTLISMLQVYGGFAVGYVARPLGALYFGNMGDTKGRKLLLSYSCIISGAATMLIGLLPNYNLIGITSTLGLIVLRLIQGFALSGEQSGALVYLNESNTKDKRSVETMYIISIFAGVLLATSLSWLISTFLSQDSLRAWGWRVPFILSFPLCLVATIIRRRFKETKQFTQLVDSGRVKRLPIYELFKNYRANLLFPFVYTAIYASLTSLYMVALPGYLHMNSTLTGESIFLLESLGIVLAISLFPSINKSLCKFSFSTRIMLTLLSVVTLVGISLQMIKLSQHWETACGIIIMAIAMAMIAAPLVTVISKPFPSKVRCSGVAVSFNWAVAMFTSTTPFIMLYIMEKFNSIVYMSIWYAALAIIAVFALGISFNTVEIIEN